MIVIEDFLLKVFINSKNKLQYFQNLLESEVLNKMLQEKFKKKELKKKEKNYESKKIPLLGFFCTGNFYFTV
jgi:coenzyme F420-reducing hydrogenase beta subunit